jgi:two-component system, LytTR family, response regulator
MRVYLVDDEELAIRRLSRLLEATGKVEIVGSTTDPEVAREFLEHNCVDAVFLDIQMPELTGFDLIARLSQQPPVIFTTAYDEFALKAFEFNSIDYLLKPVEPERLEMALAKLEKMSPAEQSDLRELVKALAKSRTPMERIASRVGERVVFVDLAAVTHFQARDKLTYAITESKEHVIDQTIAELEASLDPARFLRIHRSTIVNADYLGEVRISLGGRMTIRLKDSRELPVARDRARDLRTRLGF